MDPAGQQLTSINSSCLSRLSWPSFLLRMFAFVQSLMAFLPPTNAPRDQPGTRHVNEAGTGSVAHDWNNSTINIDDQHQRPSTSHVNVNEDGTGSAVAHDGEYNSTIDIDQKMKEKYKAACLIIIPVSGGGLVGVIAGLLDYSDQMPSLVYEPLFRAYIICVYVSFLSCAAVMLMYLLRSYMRSVMGVFDFFLWIGFGTFVYAPVLAICLVIPMGFSFMVLSLLSPSYPFLVILLTFLINLRRGRRG